VLQCGYSGGFLRSWPGAKGDDEEPEVQINRSSTSQTSVSIEVV
jgi:hypothetical protein